MPESEKGSAWIHGVVQEALDKYFASLRPDSADKGEAEETGVSR